MQSEMRVAVGQFSNTHDHETFAFAAQLGVKGIQFNTPDLPGDKKWNFKDLKALHDCVKAYGLTIEAIENVPVTFYDRIMLGLPGRDEQIAHYCETIRNIGRAGIPVLGYHFMPNFVWRTSFETPGRGGARVSSFDSALEGGGNAVPIRIGAAEAVRRVSEEEMWENYTFFIKSVLPVAEEAGVRLALHPDDPPMAEVGGMARLFYNGQFPQGDGDRRQQGVGT